MKDSTVKSSSTNGTKHKVVIDYSRDDLLADYSVGMLNGFYMRESEKSPQDAYARAATAWSTFKGKTDHKMAQRLYDAVSQKWFMFASPVLSNAPNGNPAEDRGMPISCFLSFVDDSISGLIEHSSELRWLSVMGGGVGGHWSDVRTVSDKAPGPIPFLHTVDADMIAYKQGKTRKGSYAAYMDISHPDIIEFLNIRVPTGDVQRKALNIHNAINISDEFMTAAKNDDLFDLRDPSSNKTIETVRARTLWERIMEVRFRTGEPYLNFIDTANRHLPQLQKDLGLKIHGSNLCNEIHLATGPGRTAVCCLSSLNLEMYEQWKDTELVSDLVRMLDNVLEFFIENAPKEIGNAIYSAKRERSIGLGTMGFHSLLQSQGIAWESEEARVLNKAVFKSIKTQATAESMELGTSRGCAPDMEGSGMRNAHLMALAPNASSAIILSTSPSIEPNKANAYTHRTRSGSFLVKNPYVGELLTKHNRNDDATWSSIITNKGSVAQLSFLNSEEKAVFKTAQELDQNWVVSHAADRQPDICQGQSVNLFFPSGADKSYVSGVHMRAYFSGLKGLYYLRTEAKSRAETVSSKVERVALEDYKGTIVYGTKTCPHCATAKEELTMRGIPFEWIDLGEVGKTAKEVTGRDVKTVPQIYLDGDYIGGHQDLMNLFNQIENPQQEDDGDDECVACHG